MIRLLKRRMNYWKMFKGMTCPGGHANKNFSLFRLQDLNVPENRRYHLQVQSDQHDPDRSAIPARLDPDQQRSFLTERASPVPVQSGPGYSAGFHYCQLARFPRLQQSDQKGLSIGWTCQPKNQSSPDWFGHLPPNKSINGRRYKLYTRILVAIRLLATRISLIYNSADTGQQFTVGTGQHVRFFQ